MFAATALAVVLRPTQKIADQGPRIDLAAMIPQRFGDWEEEKVAVGQIVNPQTKELLDKLYSQMLSRTYRNGQGYRIMLSVAYGGDQSDAMQVHKPEVCYPAQGFQLEDKTSAVLSIANASIPVTRLVTHLGQRHEPITYWTTVGDRTVKNGIHKKLVEMSYGLTGKIPDGMLVRVSSIDPDARSAYLVHEKFIDQMVSAVTADGRLRLIGAGL